MEAIRKITGAGADFTLECSGSPKAFRQAIDAVALRGICGIVGAPAFGTEVPVSLGILLGRTVRGIVQGDSVPDLFIPRLIELYKRPFSVRSAAQDLQADRINQAVEDLKNGTIIKASFIPDSHRRPHRRPYSASITPVSRERGLS